MLIPTDPQRPAPAAARPRRQPGPARRPTTSARVPRLPLVRSVRRASTQHHIREHPPPRSRTGRSVRRITCSARPNRDGEPPSIDETPGRIMPRSTDPMRRWQRSWAAAVTEGDPIAVRCSSIETGPVAMNSSRPAARMGSWSGWSTVDIGLSFLCSRPARAGRRMRRPSSLLARTRWSGQALDLATPMAFRPVTARSS